MNSDSSNDIEKNNLPNPSAKEWHPSFNPWLITISVMCATFMEVLDTSVATVSLPHIAGSLSASTDEATWVLTSYLISNAIILPSTNWLSSFFGRKQLLMGCIAIFTLSSALCGAATSLGMLIAARVIQGMGGGVLQPIAQAVLLESWPLEKRGQAMAVYGMGIIVAPIIGPTLGGWITDNYSWRWIFYINVPVGVAAVFMVQSFIENPPYLQRGSQRPIDYIGFGLMTLWLSTLQIVLDKGQEEDWFASNWITWFAVISAVAMILFIIQELRTEDPIVDLRVLKNRNVGVGVLLIMAVGAVLYSTTTQLPLFLQTLLAYPALQSGLAVSPRGIGSMLSMIIVGRLVGRVSSRFLISFGFGLLAFSVHILSGLTLEIAKTNVIWPNILNGFAMGFIFVPLTTTTMASLRREQIGNATGIYSLARNIGGSAGISAVTTMLSRGAQYHQAVLVNHLGPYDPMFRDGLAQIQELLVRLSDPHYAAQQAYGVIYGILQKQAMLLAFMDNFRILALMCLLCIPLVFLFRADKIGGRPGAAMH
ncbi:MAG: DHA2 family efflux MFS transporter permease subunit [Desulfomonilaceae bacterium]